MPGVESGRGAWDKLFGSRAQMVPQPSPGPGMREEQSAPGPTGNHRSPSSHRPGELVGERARGPWEAGFPLIALLRVQLLATKV